MLCVMGISINGDEIRAAARDLRATASVSVSESTLPSEPGGGAPACAQFDAALAQWSSVIVKLGEIEGRRLEQAAADLVGTIEDFQLIHEAVGVRIDTLIALTGLGARLGRQA